MNIAWKELFAITTVVNTCGHHWACKKVILHCDNQAVVDIWKAGTTKSAGTMALVCMLYSCEAKHYINVITTHVKSVNSATVDAISCFQVTLF